MIKQTALLSAISLTLIVSPPASANQQRGGWWNWGQRNQAPAPTAAPAPTTTPAAAPTATPTGASHKEHEKEDAALHKEEATPPASGKTETAE